MLDHVKPASQETWTWRKLARFWISPTGMRTARWRHRNPHAVMPGVRWRWRNVLHPNHPKGPKS